MNPEQVTVIISHAVSACEIAFIHLGNVLEQRGVISKEDLAKSFEYTARLLPPDLQSRVLAEKVLNGIAAGLRDSRPPTLSAV